MADENTPPADDDAGATLPPDDTPPADPDAELLAQADNPDAVKRALQAERAAAKKAREEAQAALARVKEFEDRDKTEQEKAAERLAALEARSAQLEAENLRLLVAHEKKLPPELARRLQGEDREALEADADSLLALVTTTNAPRGSADQGARQGGNKQLDADAIKRMTPDQIVQARKDGRLDAYLGVSQ